MICVNGFIDWHRMLTVLLQRMQTGREGATVMFAIHEYVESKQREAQLGQRKYDQMRELQLHREAQQPITPRPRRRFTLAGQLAGFFRQ
jgi:hypothetical protein